MFSLRMSRKQERRIPDMAILNCLPLCKEDWHDRVYGTLQRDFVRLCADNGSGGDIDAAWSAFSGEAAFVSKKLEAFKSRCAQVHCKASAADVRNVAHQYKTLVVIAHWKGATPIASDIRQPATLQGLLADLRTGGVPAEAGDASPGTALMQARAYIHPPGGEQLHEAERHLYAAERRRQLDQWGCTHAGNRLELWSEMLSAAEFSALFPAGFDGTLYMVSCNSHLLADCFRVAHPNAMCIANRDTVWAGLSLAKLDAALAIVAASGVMLWRGLELAGDVIDSL